MSVILGTIAIVIVVVAIGMLLDRKVGFLPAPEDFDTNRERKKLASHGPGEAPATALRIDATQIAKLRTSQRCTSCRKELRNEADDSVRFDENELVILHFTCTGCDARRTLYVERVERSA
jgi:RNase P subunit RPR2